MCEKGDRSVSILAGCRAGNLHARNLERGRVWRQDAATTAAEDGGATVGEIGRSVSNAAPDGNEIIFGQRLLGL